MVTPLISTSVMFILIRYWAKDNEFIYGLCTLHPKD